jgi:hypothetical protein
MPACWDGKLGRKVAQARFSQPEPIPPQLPFDRNRRRGGPIRLALDASVLHFKLAITSRAW